MNTLKTLLRIDVWDIISIIVVALIVYAFLHRFWPPANPISICIGSVLGNRFGRYLDLRKNPPER